MSIPSADVARGAGRAPCAFLRLAGPALIWFAMGAGTGHAQGSTCVTDAGGVTQCSAAPRYQADSVGILRSGTAPQDPVNIPALRGEDETEDVGAAFRNMTPQPQTSGAGIGCRTDATGVTRC